MKRTHEHRRLLVRVHTPTGVMDLACPDAASAVVLAEVLQQFWPTCCISGVAITAAPTTEQAA